MAFHIKHSKLFFKGKKSDWMIHVEKVGKAHPSWTLKQRLLEASKTYCSKK